MSSRTTTRVRRILGPTKVVMTARTRVSPPDRTLLLLLALYSCWGSAIPAMRASLEGK